MVKVTFIKQGEISEDKFKFAVIAAKYAGTEIKLDEEEYTVLHIGDILAIVE